MRFHAKRPFRVLPCVSVFEGFFRELPCPNNLLPGKSLPYRTQRTHQRLLRDRFHESLHRPRQPSGNGTAQTNGFALQENALRRFLELPVTVQAPKKTAIVADRILLLPAPAGMLDLRDACGYAAAVGASRAGRFA